MQANGWSQPVAMSGIGHVIAIAFPEEVNVPVLVFNFINSFIVSFAFFHYSLTRSAVCWSAGVDITQ